MLPGRAHLQEVPVQELVLFSLKTEIRRFNLKEGLLETLVELQKELLKGNLPCNVKVHREVPIDPAEEIQLFSAQKRLALLKDLQVEAQQCSVPRRKRAHLLVQVAQADLVLPEEDQTAKNF